MNPNFLLINPQPTRGKIEKESLNKKEYVTTKNRKQKSKNEI